MTDLESVGASFAGRGDCPALSSPVPEGSFYCSKMDGMWRVKINSNPYQFMYPRNVTSQQTMDEAVYKVASLNATYLGITLSALLAIGTIAAGINYWAFIRPHKERQDEQEKNIKELESQFKKQISEQKQSFDAENRAREVYFKQQLEKHEDEFKFQRKQLGETINAIEKIREETGSEIREGLAKLSSEVSKFQTLIDESKTSQQALERKIALAEMWADWNEHYLWEAKEVPVNVISSLIASIESAVKLNAFAPLNLFCTSLLNKVEQNDKETFKGKLTRIKELMAQIIDEPKFEKSHKIAEKIRKKIATS